MTIRIFDFADGFTSSTAPSEGGSYSISANQAIASGGTITLGTSDHQILKVSGSGGAQTASTTPFGATPPSAGTIISLHGTDNTNTLTLTHNDIADGCLLNGDAQLGLNDILTVYYDDGYDRYIEISRNF